MSPTGFDVAPTVGALEIGILFAVCLFGAVTVQVAIYYTRFPTDPYVLKGLVALVWCLDFSHTLALCDTLYTLTVIQYGHPELLELVPDSLNITIVLSGFIGPLEQGWFAYRLYKFSHSWYLPSFCFFLSTIRACGSVVAGAIALQRVPVTVYIDKWGWIIEILLVIGAVTDILLVLGLCYYLSEWRGEGFVRMNRLVNRLMQWSIESGVITSLGAIILFICFVTMRSNFNWMAISAVLPKLFSNSLLFSLNARRPSLHAPDLRRRDSFPSIHSADPLTSEFKFDSEARFRFEDTTCPAPAKWRSDRHSFSAVSLHVRGSLHNLSSERPMNQWLVSQNSYIFPPGEGMPVLAP